MQLKNDSMEGNLVIVESPGKIKTIQKILGDKYVVKASIGHIRDLMDNKLSIDIENGFAPQYVIPADKKKVVTELKKLAKEASTVWLASDEDREGEAIAWHLFETLGLDKSKTKRIVFHEITKNAILDAVTSPRDINMNLVDAQQARRVLDRLVGFELSPVLWRKVQPKLSAGRVQSVALRLVVDREKEIMNFKPEAFYRVDAEFCTPKDRTQSIKATLDTRFNGIEEAQKFLEDSIGAEYKVAELETKEGSRFPSAPFTTSTLQQEASRKLHFPVSVTMKVAQSLYEKGLITYMRTDSTNLSSLALGAAKDFIIENFGKEYSSPRQFKTKAKGAQEAHEAIRPTYLANEHISGTAQEQKLYSLIWKRTIASQMADASLLNTSIKVSSSKRSEMFNIQSSTILFDGFLKVYFEDQDDAEAGDVDNIFIPKLNLGDVLTDKVITAKCKYTHAPYRYSEATLVKKLEELGIGRPSTYAPTISTLTTGRGYIAKGDKEGEKVTVSNLTLKKGAISSSEATETVGAEKGKLFPQEIGMIVTDYLVKNFSDILSYDFTANVERNFDSIADGKMEWNSVISDFYKPFHEKIEESISSKEYANNVSREIGTAPDGELLVAKFGKYGAYIQKGDPQKRQFANLWKGQLIENITVEEALKLFELPRTLGEYKGIPVIATKGKYGPYLKYGDQNISLPRGTNPLEISLEYCGTVIESNLNKTASKKIIAEFKNGEIQILEGQYGPYIKANGSNYRIPKDADAASLTEEACIEIVNNAKPTAPRGRRRAK